MKIGDGARTVFGKREGLVEMIIGDLIGVRHTDLVFYPKGIVDKIDHLAYQHNKEVREASAIKRAEKDAKR